MSRYQLLAVCVWPLAAGVATFGMLTACAGRVTDERSDLLQALQAKGLQPEVISAERFFRGQAPEDFTRLTAARYKPSYNEEPGIPAQCWIETGYGTQNACQYCHTDYLAQQEHGNNYPIAEDQLLYSFPTPGLNRVLWRNVIFPEEIDQRLAAEGVAIPSPADVAYVRQDNWTPTYVAARAEGSDRWFNSDASDDALALFPALDPRHLYPYTEPDPTGGSTHGYVDPDGFVRNQENGYTGWRAINFFPYAIFTPLTGSVSGIYLRLPAAFMNRQETFDAETYKRNLDLLERNIKNQPGDETHYYGDASEVAVQKGFYPVGTEFAHPLHYVDLYADGQMGERVNGVAGNTGSTYEFPGTRSKRVKEIRYMYKWREVDLDDIGADDEEEQEGEEEAFVSYIGREGQGWVENGAGWILAAYIEDRRGALRPQTTEELAQCIGCHANVGNTVDAVWSFQRKHPGALGWREMDYGDYRFERRDRTRLPDYLNVDVQRGELEYFYYTVVGADLYGVMPAEVAGELVRWARATGQVRRLELSHPLEELFDDEALKYTAEPERRSRLIERQRFMRAFAEQRAYLDHDTGEDSWYVRGTLFYPREETMRTNIHLYRKIVLDQSFNLGKDVFGTENTHVPFTFRSDGQVRDAQGVLIPAGEVITSRPYGEDGVGTTPTGIAVVDDDGEPVDARGRRVDLTRFPRQVGGHFSTGGTFNPLYNPILSGIAVRGR